MDYDAWIQSVPVEITADALWQMTVYRQALYLGELAWQDMQTLASRPGLLSLSDQLYRAVGSVSANIAEGYSRRSDLDQARFYEYALGSAREARDWYYKSRHALGQATTSQRIDFLVQINRQLLKIIPTHRGRKIPRMIEPYR